MIHALPPAIVAGELVRLQTRQRVVALTFDGGGNADAAKSVLAILKRERVPGTFFLTGQFVRTYPLLSRAIGRRFPVANHTVDHLDLRRLSTPAATREITRAETMIRRATSRDPRPLFRFPYGARDARTLALCRRLGYDGELDRAFNDWAGTENLEERVDGVERIDPVVLGALRKQSSSN